MAATKNLWVIHMKRLKDNPELLEKVDEGYVAIGWKGIDLTKENDKEKIKKTLIGYIDEKSIPMTAGQMYRFGYEAKKDEYVILPISGSDIVKIGIFSDSILLRDNSFDEHYVHVRKVEWLKDVPRSDFSQKTRNTIGSFTSFCTGGDHVETEVVALLTGKNITQRTVGDEQDVAEEEMEFALEKFLEEFLMENWDKINFGEDLTIYSDKDGNPGNQYRAGDCGNIDILAQDRKGNFVIIELKKGRKTDAVVGQVLRYMGWVRKNLAKKEQDVRGLIIVGEKDAKLEYSISEVSDKVSLKVYKINFSLLH